MITKGPNGTNLADEFAPAHLSDLPKRTGVGKPSTPIDPAILANVRDLLTDTNVGVIQGKTMYSATKAELDAYNKDNDHPLVGSGALVELAMRFAFNASGNIRRYAKIVAAEQTPAKAVGVRTVNKGTADRPQVVWYILLTTPKPRKANA